MNNWMLLLIVLAGFLVGIALGGIHLNVQVPPTITSKAEEVLNSLPPVVEGLEKAVELLQAEAEAVNVSMKAVEQSARTVEKFGWVTAALIGLAAAALVGMRKIVHYAVLQDLQQDKEIRGLLRGLISPKRRRKNKKGR